MSAPGPGEPAPVPRGSRPLRIAVRAVEAAWFVGVPLSLLIVFRLPFAETVAAFVVWLAVLLAIERFVSAGPANGAGIPGEDSAP